MNILITGVAGFIGSHLVSHLLSMGATVVGIDSLFDNNDLDLKRERLAHLGIDTEAIGSRSTLTGTGGWRFMRLDVLNVKGVDELFAREHFDAVFHLAAVTGSHLSSTNAALCFDVNVRGTGSVLEAARRHGTRHVLFASSSAVYDRNVHSPIIETASAGTPTQAYAASKRAAEMMCSAYAHQFGMHITVFRFFNAYGIRGRKDSIPMRLIRDVLEGNEIKLPPHGGIVRDFTYIEDILEGMMAALNTTSINLSGNSYDLFNIGRSKPVSIETLVQTIAAHVGRPANIVRTLSGYLTFGEQPEIYADTTKLERDLAYSPVWDCEEALPSVIDWFRSHYHVTFDM